MGRASRPSECMMKSSNLRLVPAYIVALLGSLWLGYQLRFDFAVPRETARSFPLIFTWVIGLKVLCLWRFGQFDVLLGYFGLPDFTRLSRMLFAPSVIVFAVSTQLGSDYAPPRGVVL